MAVEDDFANLEARFSEFQSRLARMQAQVPANDEHAVKLKNLSELMQKQFSEFSKAFQQENARLNAERAAAQKQIQKAGDAVKAEKAARDKMLSQAKLAADIPAAEAELPVDPELGTRMRALILKEMEVSLEGTPGARSAGDVAGMESSEWKSETGQPAPTPKVGDKPKPSPRKPKAGNESFEWESTGEWER